MNLPDTVSLLLTFGGVLFVASFPKRAINTSAERRASSSSISWKSIISSLLPWILQCTGRYWCKRHLLSCWSGHVCSVCVVFTLPALSTLPLATARSMAWFLCLAERDILTLLFKYRASIGARLSVSLQLFVAAQHLVSAGVVRESVFRSNCS